MISTNYIFIFNYFLFSVTYFFKQGGFGYDFSSDVSQIKKAVNVVSKELLQHGVTSFCPTIVTSPPEIYKQVHYLFKIFLIIYCLNCLYLKSFKCYTFFIFVLNWNTI